MLQVMLHFWSYSIRCINNDFTFVRWWYSNTIGVILMIFFFLYFLQNIDWCTGYCALCLHSYIHFVIPNFLHIKFISMVLCEINPLSFKGCSLTPCMSVPSIRLWVVHPKLSKVKKRGIIKPLLLWLWTSRT